MSLARFDTWVRAVVGPAAAGALVYICTQPATTNTIPPSPLALLYEDSGSVTPLSQPLVCDGFGHAYAYLAAGTYTVVVVQGGVIQQVYPDQLIGGAGGSSFTLQTNGTPNPVQSLLNLKSGTNISLVSDNLGGVTISDTLTPLSLETNGTPNTDQALLNLKSGSGVNLTADGSGGVTIANTNQGAVFNVSGQGWFAGPALNVSSMSNNFNSQITNFSAGTVIAEQFILSATWTLSGCAYQLSSTGSAGNTFAFGIYDASGNKLIDCEFDATVSTLQSKTFTAVTLSPGVYFFAYASSETSATGPHVQWTVDTLQQNLDAVNARTALISTAANTYSGGALPATLGTRTAITSVLNYQGTCIPVWSV